MASKLVVPEEIIAEADLLGMVERTRWPEEAPSLCPMDETHIRCTSIRVVYPDMFHKDNSLHREAMRDFKNKLIEAGFPAERNPYITYAKFVYNKSFRVTYCYDCGVYFFADDYVQPW